MEGRECVIVDEVNDYRAWLRGTEWSELRYHTEPLDYMFDSDGFHARSILVPGAADTYEAKGHIFRPGSADPQGPRVARSWVSGSVSENAAPAAANAAAVAFKGKLVSTLAEIGKLSNAQLPRIGYEASAAGRTKLIDEVLRMFRASPCGSDPVGCYPSTSESGPQFTDGRVWPPPVFTAIQQLRDVQETSEVTATGDVTAETNYVHPLVGPTRTPSRLPQQVAANRLLKVNIGPENIKIDDIRLVYYDDSPPHVYPVSFSPMLQHLVACKHA